MSNDYDSESELSALRNEVSTLSNQLAQTEGQLAEAEERMERNLRDADEARWDAERDVRHAREEQEAQRLELQYALDALRALYELRHLLPKESADAAVVQQINDALRAAGEVLDSVVP